MTKKSYRNINYTVRAAKAVERRLLCEAFAELGAIQPVRNYHYIGFGSVYFADFALFHRRFGFLKMTSIEQEEDDEERLKFNRPFSCVDILLGSSGDILPTLPWEEERTIVWLDYDGPLRADVVADIGTFILNARSGSLLLLSLNIEPEKGPPPQGESLDEYRLKVFRERLQPRLPPLGLEGKGLAGATLPATVLRVLTDGLHSALNDRNAALPAVDKLTAERVIHFRYRDGARMLTVGWLLVSDSEKALVDTGVFDTLQLRGTADDCRKLEVPSISLKEARALGQQLPGNGDWRQITDVPVPDREKRQYSELYRHFPSFSEGDVG